MKYVNSPATHPFAAARIDFETDDRALTFVYGRRAEVTTVVRSLAPESVLDDNPARRIGYYPSLDAARTAVESRTRDRHREAPHLPTRVMPAAEYSQGCNGCTPLEASHV